MRRTRTVVARCVAVLVASVCALRGAEAQQQPVSPPVPQAAAHAAAAPGAHAVPKSNGCVDCHADAARVSKPELREPVAAFADDVHKERGLSCSDCHGGKPDVDLADPAAAAQAHDKAAGFRGKPSAAEMPGFCGRCHSDATEMGHFNPDARVDQETKYWTSVHGKRLKGGDVKVATCISCHGRHPGGEHAEALAHGIRAAGDPLAPVYPSNVAQTCGRCHADAAYMAEYKIKTDQLALYDQSVHHAAMAEHDDLSAPTCNDCHGNHGAQPPNVEDISFVCGTCHLKQAELFRQSTMKPAFDDLGLGECVVCHSNHRIVSPTDDVIFHEPLAEGSSPNGCWTCHADPEDKALATSSSMWHAIRGLDERIAQAGTVIRDAGEKGMPVSDAEYRLTGATDALVEARALVHSFKAGEVEAATAKGLTVADDALAMGQAAMGDYFFRHRWLGVSLLGIAFVIVSLVLKVRQVDRRWKARIGEPER